MTIYDILSRLDGVKGRDGQWSALCPAHNDHNNSLSVGMGKDGRILLTCHTGCALDDILDAMGLQKKDLFPDKPPDRSSGKPPVVAVYTYPSGAQKLRRADKSFLWCRPDDKGGWVYNRQSVPHELYIAGELGGLIHVVEGEKDADNFHAKLGGCAVSGADGAGGKGKWRPEYTEQLRDRPVVILQDNDDVGRAYAQQTTAALQGVAKSVRVIDLSRCWPEIPEHGDVSDMIEALGAAEAAQRLVRLEKDTPEWRPDAAETNRPPLLMPMSNVEAKHPSYLISPYLPRGMLAVMGGVSGAGKTYLVLSWIAAASNGRRLPFQDWTSPTPPKGYAYYFTQENDPNTVIRPRLDLLGANLDNVLIHASNGTVYEPLTLNDPRLEEAAKQFPPVMIVFDPIQSYLGAGWI